MSFIEIASHPDTLQLVRYGLIGLGQNVMAG